MEKMNFKTNKKLTVKARVFDHRGVQWDSFDEINYYPIDHFKHNITACGHTLEEIIDLNYYKQYIQKEKRICEACDNTISVSKMLFNLEYYIGSSKLLCTYCLTEEIGDNPANVKKVINVTITKVI